MNKLVLTAIVILAVLLLIGVWFYRPTGTVDVGKPIPYTPDETYTPVIN